MGVREGGFFGVNLAKNERRQFNTLGKGQAVSMLNGYSSSHKMALMIFLGSNLEIQ